MLFLLFIIHPRDRCKQRIERQLGIIGKAATDNEIEEMIEQSKDGKNLQIFTGVSRAIGLFSFVLLFKQKNEKIYMLVHDSS